MDEPELLQTEGPVTLNSQTAASTCWRDRIPSWGLSNDGKSRSLRAERMLDMRTKDKRERDESKQAPATKYRFTLVGIRMHDGIVLQGTFRVSETLRDVALFVQESLQD